MRTPAIFFGHGNPMNAVSQNNYTLGRMRSVSLTHATTARSPGTMDEYHQPSSCASIQMKLSVHASGLRAAAQGLVEPAAIQSPTVAVHRKDEFVIVGLGGTPGGAVSMAGQHACAFRLCPAIETLEDFPGLAAQNLAVSPPVVAGRPEERNASAGSQLLERKSGRTPSRTSAGDRCVVEHFSNDS